MIEYDKDLYDILEVSPNASEEVIKNAFRALVKKWHPDMQSEEEQQQAQEKFKEINLAFEVLKDKERKREYDKYRKEKNSNAFAADSNSQSTNYPASVNNPTSNSNISNKDKTYIFITVILY